MSEHCSVAALLTPVLLLGYDWTLSPGEGKSTFSTLKGWFSIQCCSIKVHAFNVMLKHAQCYEQNMLSP